MGDMSDEYAGHGKTGDIFSLLELCTDPCDMGPCIILLKHEVMAEAEWHDIGPQDFVTVSLCIKIAIESLYAYLHVHIISITSTNM
jgi:hypothetical protein